MDSLKGDYLRLRQYLRATVNHIIQTLDEMEKNQADDPNLEQETAMKIAAYAADLDSKPGCPVGASNLPHLAHAAASLNMAIAQAVYSGLLPEDPGRPWEYINDLVFGEEPKENLTTIPYKEERVEDLKSVPREFDGKDCTEFYTDKDNKDMIEVPGRGSYYYDTENPYGTKNKYVVANSEILERTDKQIAIKTGAYAFRVYDSDGSGRVDVRTAR
jgi:hypothetical protein